MFGIIILDVLILEIIAKPIECVVVFKKNNQPKPIRFRYKDSTQKEHVIHVDRVSKIEKRKMAGIDALVYTCFTNDKDYELKFELHTCKWVLFRI